ncbi:MAG: hypothetical protein ABR585_12525 [Gemmatimonadaceae bacterium]|nr:hypothetical protein [Actinomycetota bacterium]
MTNEDTPPECEGFTCHCGARFERLPGGGFTCGGCGTQISATGRTAPSSGLKQLAKEFSEQPVDFAQLEAKGWPGPYVGYTEADIQIPATLLEMERQLFSDDEESD